MYNPRSGKKIYVRHYSLLLLFAIALSVNTSKAERIINVFYSKYLIFARLKRDFYIDDVRCLEKITGESWAATHNAIDGAPVFHNING